MSDDAADAAAAAAAAVAEIPDYDAGNSDDGYYDSDEEGRTEDAWGEGYAAPSARGASPRLAGGASPRLAGARRQRRMRELAEVDPAVSSAPCACV